MVAATSVAPREIHFNQIPIINPFALVGQVLNAGKMMSTDLPDHLLGWQKQYGDVFRLPIPGKKVLMVGRHDLFRAMLLDQEHTIKGSLFAGLDDFLGDSVLLADGDQWLRLRRVMNKPFQRMISPRFNQLVAEETMKMSERWEGKPFVSANDEMNILALNIIWRVMFDTEREPEFMMEVAEAFAESVKFLLNKSILPLPAVFFPNYGEYKQGRDFIHDVFRRIMQDRPDAETANAREAQGLGLVQTLMDGYEQDQQLVSDQLQTLILAGHETTQLTMSWILYYLAIDPDLQGRVREEINRDYQVGRSYDQEAYPMLYAVIHEALRLWPTTFIIPRETVSEFQMGEYVIPPKTVMIASTIMAHRNPLFGSVGNPDDMYEFNPYRFIEKPSLYQQHVSFGHGPRKCVGANLSIEELKQLVATILHTYQLSYHGDTPPHHYNANGVAGPRPQPPIQFTRI